MRLNSWLIMAPLALSASGCPPEKPDTETTHTVDGVVSFEIDISADETAFLITAEAGERLALDSIVDPDGAEVLHWNDWYNAPNYLTAAVWPLGDDLVLNWPIRAEDGPLEAGTWTVSIAAVSEKGAYLDDVEVTAHRQTKRDSDWSEGLVKVVIAFAEGVEEEAEVVAAVEEAVERWREVWAPVGLELEVRYATAEIGPTLPYLGDGDSVITELSDQTASDEILMIIGESIEAEELYYGVAGNIPGALIATPRSAVTISWLANTGLDGSFSADDVRLMGETMAHETNHYMGLFHPVETTFEVWDAVRDTEDCTSAERCEDVLGDNLMFPYPVCSAFSCIPQDGITDIQAGIAHRYTGTQ